MTDAPQLDVADYDSASRSSSLYELELRRFLASKLKALVFSWECRCYLYARLTHVVPSPGLGIEF